MSEQQTSKERGIYHKFNVVRTDGKSATGQKHHGCFYFVLDCDHDPHARAALLAYAASCEADYPALASDVRAIVEHGAAFGSGEDKHVSDAVTIQPAHEPPADDHQADYAAALQEIAKGPPGHLPNDEVASWAGQIASDALSLPPRPSQPPTVSREADLEAALVYTAFSLHAMPRFQLAPRITLIDNDTVSVEIGDRIIEATWPKRSTPTKEVDHG